ncbi:hypothetical protein [Desulfogranum japonicum]|uniref:hypothetical protein n=1 Tax=Desulfogranum japonicum TaxID=231447 RepID=UPI00040294ED|nr:hypothetical protein [Desulfogranum japonicum]
MFADILDFVKGIFAPIGEAVGPFLEKIQVVEQIKEVDAAGLFTNPWFLVPFVALVGYMLYKLAWRDLIILSLLMGVWYFTGTEYMQTLVVGDQLNIQRILPVLFGGAGVLGFIIYLLFVRSD